MWPTIRLPSLGNSTPQSNLAGLLPLSSLIEFIDSRNKLHCYQLSGRSMPWNWPITPAAARLLLEFCQEEKHEESCLLDCEGRTTPLFCIDMRWGDQYNCINPFTIRSCIASIPSIKRLEIEDWKLHRPQRLEIVHVFLKHRMDNDPEAMSSFFHQLGPKWLGALSVGWAVWLGIIIFSILSARPISCAYLCTVVLTGLWVSRVYGSRPRPLIKSENTSWRRAVVVTNHVNETNWSLFVGNSILVDSLLNKPLLRPDNGKLFRISPPIRTAITKFSLRVLIAAQWGLIVAASVLQGWDAIIISIFIVFCACITEFIYRTDDFMASWLHSNKVGLEKMTVAFTGRRAMVSAMYIISPDKTFCWLDPILVPSTSRTTWEEALIARVQDGIEPAGDRHLVSAINEGIRVASEVNDWLLLREKVHNLPPRTSTQQPFSVSSEKEPLLEKSPTGFSD